MARHMTTWGKELTRARDLADDTSPMVAFSPDADAFEAEFDNGYGGIEGPEVLAWSEDRVYFPVVYDGAEDMGSAPRNPTPDGQEHVGGC